MSNNVMQWVFSSVQKSLFRIFSICIIYQKKKFWASEQFPSCQHSSKIRSICAQKLKIILDVVNSFLGDICKIASFNVTLSITLHLKYQNIFNCIMAPKTTWKLKNILIVVLKLVNFRTEGVYIVIFYTLSIIKGQFTLQA